jgi:tRNA(Ile)-lysidine synthase
VKTSRKKLSSHNRQGVSRFAQQLLSAWKQAGFVKTDEPVVVAVSGGADSTAMLLGLDELVRAGKLSVTLLVAHLDHGLREDSKTDAAAVRALASRLGYKSIIRRTDVKKEAADRNENLEQAARLARYDFLKAVATKNGARLILTAHTLDDQAETVLLRLLRGSAAEGLSGMEPVRSLEPGSAIELGRPLVSWARRSDVEDYCRSQQVEFCSDEMNQDEGFTRVRVRKQLLPLMQSFNNKIVDTLARTAQLLREDADALTVEAEQLLVAATKPTDSDGNGRRRLDVKVLAAAPAALRRRALRLWLERERGHLRRLEMVHLVGIDRLLTGTQTGRRAELPDGGQVTRKRGWLELNGLPFRKKS